MAHFAKIDPTKNVVISIEVVNNDVITIDGQESEQAGIDFLTSLYDYSHWKQASYNGSFRKNYPCSGYIYDEERDAFYEPQPYPSWVLNEDTCKWEAPITKPEIEAEYPYKWDELTLNWVVNAPVIEEETTVVEEETTDPEVIV